MTSPNNDLRVLIDAAQDEVNRQHGSPLPTAHRKVLGGRSLLLAGLACAALFFTASQLLPVVRPLSATQTQRDLETIVEQARVLVEERRAVLGRLPDALPNAALAGLVAYTPADNAYQLFAASGRISVLLDQDGKKTIHQGGPP